MSKVWMVATGLAVMLGAPLAASAQDDFERRVKELKEQYEKQRREIEKKFEGAMEELKRDFEKRVEGLKKDHGARKEGEKKKEPDKKEYDRKKEAPKDEKKDYGDKGALDKLNRRIDDLMEEVHRLRKDLEGFRGRMPKDMPRWDDFDFKEWRRYIPRGGRDDEDRFEFRFGGDKKKGHDDEDRDEKKHKKSDKKRHHDDEDDDGWFELRRRDFRGDDGERFELRVVPDKHELKKHEFEFRLMPDKHELKKHEEKRKKHHHDDDRRDY